MKKTEDKKDSKTKSSNNQLSFIQVAYSVEFEITPYVWRRVVEQTSRNCYVKEPT